MSRRETYALEEGGLALAERWLRDVLGVRSRRRTGVANYTEGDLELEGGANVEVKRQPIDPERYRRNWLEIFTIPEVPRDYHADGRERLARALRLRALELDERLDAAGVPAAPVACSIWTAMGADVYTYANPAAGYVYAETSERLRAAARRAVLRLELVHAPGRAEPGTWGAFVPLPPGRWRATASGWLWCGDGDEEAARAEVDDVLRTRGLAGWA